MLALSRGDSCSNKSVRFCICEKRKLVNEFNREEFDSHPFIIGKVNADGTAAMALAGKPLRREVHRGRRPASPKIAATGTRPSRASELLLGFPA